MTHRRNVLGLMVGGVSALALAGCGPLRRAKLRYRLTVEVDTPEGVKTGSTVIQVTIERRDAWIRTAESSGGRILFEGEAVEVVLPGGRSLFALLASNEATDLADAYPQFAFYHRLANLRGFGALKQMSRWKGQTAAIVPEKAYSDTQIIDYPKLVAFTDIKNPMTAVGVDPYALDATLGAGYRLKQISVTITDDEVTKGIEKRLPWLIGEDGKFPKMLNHQTNSGYDLRYPEFAEGTGQ